MSQRRKYIYTVLISLVLIRGSLIRIFFPEYTVQQQVLLIIVGLFFTIAIFEVIEFINNTLNRRMPFENGPVERLITQVLLCLLVTFSVHTVILLFFAEWLPKEFNRLVMAISYFIDFVLVVAFNLGYFGAHFFTQWKYNLIKAERLEKEKALVQKERAQVQFANLQNQLNPHFLFNSLSSLNGLIHENPKLATDFLNQLSKVFRYVLENREKEFVTLETEVQFVSRYIFLLKTRFGEGLRIEIDLDDEQLFRRIVPVTLQILIENAVKHNVINDENHLTITISGDDQYLVVHNNRHPKTLVESSNKVGLTNLKALYQYLSPLPVLLAEEDHSFAVKIPFL